MFAGFWSNRCGAGQASALTAPWGLPVAVTNERTEKRAQLSFNFAWNYTDSEHASFGGLSRSGHILYIVHVHVKQREQNDRLQLMSKIQSLCIFEAIEPFSFQNLSHCQEANEIAISTKTACVKSICQK